MSKRRLSTRRAAPAAVAVQHSTPALVGRLVAGSTVDELLVEFPGSAGAQPARTTVPLDPAIVTRALATGQGALLLLENGEPTRPILVGFLQPSRDATPFFELLASSRSREPEQGVQSVELPRTTVHEARLDGESVVLEAKSEIVLKCGEASITLRRDGRVIVRGTYVETYARGVNRIKGGAVKIN